MKPIPLQMRKSSRAAQLLAACCTLAMTATAASATYRVGPSDVLEISVTAVPQLQGRVAVQPDGTISFPHLGTMTVADLTLEDLRTRIRSRLGGRAITISNSTDGPVTVAIDFNDVLVNVASYRPIYVRGEVAKPGVYAYQGPIAVREALAMAGGWLGSASVGQQLLMQSVGLRRDLESHWLAFIQERAKLWRIKAEIGEPVEDISNIGRSVPADAEISRSDVERIVSVANEHLRRRLDDYRHEQETLEAVIGQLDAEIVATEGQVTEGERAFKEELEEFTRLTELKDRRVISPQRYAEARRDLVASSTRSLIAVTRLNDAKRQKIERQLQLHKLAADRSEQLYAELEASTVKVSELRARLRGVSQQLLIVDGGGRLGPSGAGRAMITVFRRTANGRDRFEADDSFELAPGDVVEVGMTNGLEHEVTR